MIYTVETRNHTDETWRKEATCVRKEIAHSICEYLFEKEYLDPEDIRITEDKESSKENN